MVVIGFVCFPDWKGEVLFQVLWSKVNGVKKERLS